MNDSAAADSAAADSAAADSAAEFARRGFCVVENVLTAAELALLRREADALRSQTSVADLCDENCVLEALPSGMPDGSAARTSWDAYLARRAADPADRAILQNLLERKLAGVLRATLSTDSVYLFNEHFVVKPPGAGRFAWHTDAAHQLEAVLALGVAPGARSPSTRRRGSRSTTSTPPTASCCCCRGTRRSRRARGRSSPPAPPRPRGSSRRRRRRTSCGPPRARATRSSSPRRCGTRPSPTRRPPTAARTTRSTRDRRSRRRAAGRSTSRCPRPRQRSGRAPTPILLPNISYNSHTRSSAHG